MRRTERIRFKSFEILVMLKETVYRIISEDIAAIHSCDMLIQQSQVPIVHPPLIKSDIDRSIRIANLYIIRNSARRKCVNMRFDSSDNNGVKYRGVYCRIHHANNVGWNSSFDGESCDLVKTKSYTESLTSADSVVDILTKSCKSHSFSIFCIESISLEEKPMQ